VKEMVRKRTKRDTYNYVLKQGRKIVYRGITNDPDRRLKEHENSGKRFSHMVVNPYPVSRKTALEREKG
jgi:predicted GIY-YIG superfamily endonuclease